MMLSATFATARKPSEDQRDARASARPRNRPSSPERPSACLSHSSLPRLSCGVATSGSWFAEQKALRVCNPRTSV
jgi:hypothetical protein